MQAKRTIRVSAWALGITLVVWLAATRAAAQPSQPGSNNTSADERGAVTATSVSGATARCVQGQDGSSLCLQALQNTGTSLRAFLTAGTPSQEVKFLEAPALTVDGVKLTPNKAVAFADSDEPLSVIAVIQLAGRQKDKEAFPVLQQGLLLLGQTVTKLRQVRIGVLGYNVTRASYQPNVELGEVSRLPAVVQALQLPDIRAVSFELHDALDEAITRLDHESASRRKMIIVFTDGEEKDRSRVQLFEKLVRRANQADIVVNVIMLPSRGEPKDFLSAFVEGTGGKIRQSRDLPTLGAAFEATMTELTKQTVATYSLDRLPLARAGGRRVHQVQLEQGPLLLKTSWQLDWRSPTVTPHGEQVPSTESGATAGSPLLIIVISGAAVVVGSGLLLLRRKNFRRSPTDQVKVVPTVRTPPALPPSPTVRNPVNPPPSVAPVYPAVPPPNASQATPDGQAVCWLYEVKRQRTHLVDRFPFSVGNDLDCDLVLGGLGEPVAVGLLSADGHNFYLQAQPEGRWSLRGRLLARRELLAERTEFAVGNHRLVLFKTPLNETR